jgi:hypothetical protein
MVNDLINSIIIKGSVDYDSKPNEVVWLIVYDQNPSLYLLSSNHFSDMVLAA